MRLHLSMCLMLAMIVCLLAGCQTGPRIYHVKGTVTYEGKPVPAGMIFFDPDAAKQNDGPPGYAFIKDGAYDTAAQGGKGVIGNAYLVRIQGFDGTPGHELTMGRPLFTNFQEAVEFPLDDSTRDFHVPAK